MFEEEGALDRLEAFASLNGPRFYGLSANDELVTLHRESWTIPETVAVKGDAVSVRPFMAGELALWRAGSLP